MAAVAAGLCGLLALPFLIMLCSGVDPVLGHPAGDNPRLFYYFGAYCGAVMRHGQLPLWNPHIMLGLPQLGEGQAAMFHPLSWCFVVLRPGLAYDLVALLAFISSSLGMLCWLRALGRTRYAAVVGSLIWSFSSVFISRFHAGHLTIMLALASWPWLLAAWDWHRRGGELRPLLGFAVAYGLMILAGHPQLLLIASLFVLLYVLLQWAADRSLTRSVGLLGLAVLLGVALGAIQLLPSWDFAQNSFRRHASFEFCTLFSLAPENLLTLICPGFFGTEPVSGAGQYWGRNFLWEMWLYIGILPLVLAVPGVGTVARPQRSALVACGLLFLIVALGRHTPLYRLLYQALPLFDVFRSPAKFSLVTLTCLVPCAAAGCDWLLQADRDCRRWRLAVVAAGGILATVVALLLVLRPGESESWRGLLEWRYRQGEIFMPMLAIDQSRILGETGAATRAQLLRSGILAVVALAILALAVGRWRRHLPATLIVALVIDLGTFFWPFFDWFPEAEARYAVDFPADGRRPDPAPLRVADLSTLGNPAMIQGLSGVGGYAGNTLPRFNTYINRTQDFSDDFSQAAVILQRVPPRYRFLAVEGVIERDGAVRALDQPAPRTFLAADRQRADSAEDALDYFLSGATDPIATPVVETMGRLPPGGRLTPDEGVEIIAFSPTRVVLRSRAIQERVLVLNEAWYKDWQARIDGRPTAVFPANYLFRGIVVPAGEVTVEFIYRSTAFASGRVITVCALLLWALALCLTRSERRPNQSAEVPDLETGATD